MVGGTADCFRVLPKSKACAAFDLERKKEITDTALAHALNRLCSHGIIQRTQTDEVPSRAVYALTEMGWSVIPIFESICQWSGRYYQPEDGHTLIKCRNCDKCFQKEKHETKASLPKETP